MQARKTSFLPLALYGIVAMALGAESAHAVAPFFSAQEQNLDRTATPAMQYFGGGRIRTSSQYQRRNRMPAPLPLQLRGTKPFESLTRPPTLSPYLNLDVRESALGIPSYHAFVRPLQQQRSANIEQAAKLRKLQQKLRRSTAQGIVSNNPTGGVPTTGHSSQFLNLGGYFDVP